MLVLGAGLALTSPAWSSLGAPQVSLKSLNTINLLTTSSPAFAAAALTSCTAAVGSAQEFSKLDPVHGDLPANKIRTEAVRVHCCAAVPRRVYFQPASHQQSGAE